MVEHNNNSPVEAINAFWNWFGVNAKSLEILYTSDRLDLLSQQVNQELDKVEPQLAWEIGPGKNKSYLLTISSEGDRKLRQIADLMIQLAPTLQEWEFYSSRPSRPAPAVVRLPESGESFQTSEWRFIPVEQPRSGRVDLIVVDDKLAHSDHSSALKAISIYLDELLGEDTVEEWIGEFKVERMLAAHGKQTYEMTELPDYLLWATHRASNPLKKISNRTF